MENIRNDKMLNEVVGAIVELTAPTKVILYNSKLDMDGVMTSFKLCIVGPMDEEEKKKVLRRVFSQVDCQIPYDILLYSDSQFENLRNRENAFAQQVDQKGKVLYGV